VFSTYSQAELFSESQEGDVVGPSLLRNGLAAKGCGLAHTSVGLNSIQTDAKMPCSMALPSCILRQPSRLRRMSMIGLSSPQRAVYAVTCSSPSGQRVRGGLNHGHRGEMKRGRTTVNCHACGVRAHPTRGLCLRGLSERLRV
jgi:hypothetical protein